MKRLASFLLVLATTACTAQQAPVNIAVELYKGCLIGFTQAYGIPQTKQAIINQATELDANCTEWAYIWTPTMLNKDKGGLNFAESLRFVQRKNELIASYKEELILTLPK